MSYSGNTLAFQAKARGSIPLIRFFVYIKGFNDSTSGEVKRFLHIIPKIRPKWNGVDLASCNFIS